MVEQNNPFRLTVVGSAIEGNYLVGYYHKFRLKAVEGLVGVIKVIGSFNTAILKCEPTYCNLLPETQELIETIRQVLVKRDEALLEHWPKTVKNVHDRLPLRLKMSDKEIELKLKELETESDSSSQS